MKNFGVVIYFGYINVRQKLRQLFDAEDDVEDSPSTEVHERQISTESAEENEAEFHR